MIKQIYFFFYLFLLLWNQNQIRGFVVQLSLQQDYCKLARTPAVTMHPCYLHCICTGLAKLTSYYIFAMITHELKFSSLIWLYSLCRAKNKQKTLKLVTTHL